MERFALLLERHPLVFAHLALAFAALALGSFMLWGRKGNSTHRRVGWVWVLLMGGVAVTSAFIRDYSLPNLAGITPIHALTVLVMWQLPRGIWHARHGRVEAHRKTLRGLYLGGCLVAGALTLLPGRFLGRQLWQHTLGWMA